MMFEVSSNYNSHPLIDDSVKSGDCKIYLEPGIESDVGLGVGMDSFGLESCTLCGGSLRTFCAESKGGRTLQAVFEEGGSDVVRG